MEMMCASFPIGSISAAIIETRLNAFLNLLDDVLVFTFGFVDVGTSTGGKLRFVHDVRDVCDAGAILRKRHHNIQ